MNQQVAFHLYDRMNGTQTLAAKITDRNAPLLRTYFGVEGPLLRQDYLVVQSSGKFEVWDKLDFEDIHTRANMKKGKQ